MTDEEFNLFLPSHPLGFNKNGYDDGDLPYYWNTLVDKGSAEQLKMAVRMFRSAAQNAHENFSSTLRMADDRAAKIGELNSKLLKACKVIRKLLKLRH